MFNICFSSNNDYIQHLSVAIVSLLENNPGEDFNIYVLDGNISNQNKEKLNKIKDKWDFNLEFISIDTGKFKNCPVPEGSHFSVEAYYRFLIPELFSSLDKILYLDCDLVVLGDISKIYATELGDNYFAMAKDVDYQTSLNRLGLEGESPYFNSGVTLFNIRKCLDDKLIDKLFAWTAANKEKIMYVEQDTLNVVCREMILQLPWQANVMVRVFDCENNRKIENFFDEVIILHYIGMGKPWNDKNFHRLYKPYFNYLKCTPFKYEYYKRKISRFFFYKDDESKKVKIFKITIARTIADDNLYRINILGVNIYERKKDANKKIIKIFSIPVLKLKENKWKMRYNELLDSTLTNEQIKEINTQLESLDAIKILKEVAK